MNCTGVDCMKKETPKYTPMMMQYLEVKKNYQDAIVFYRLGDFYEMFFDDAKIASVELDLVLTGRNAGVEERVPMCGIPHHAYKNYLQKLVSRGYKVAIVEQLENPADAEGIVKRDVIQVVTPGTIMEEGLESKNSIQLADIVDNGFNYVLSMVEMTTGETTIKKVNHVLTTLSQTLLKNNIKEVVLHEGFDEKVLNMIRNMGSVTISFCNEDHIEDEYLELCEAISKDGAALKAYGLMLNYLVATQKRMMHHLQVIEVENEHDFMAMDFSTQQNLELVMPLRTQSKGDTLWSFLDCCQSSMGSRMLRKWIEKPLVNQAKIEHRYDQVEVLVKDFMKREACKDYLASIYDLERLIARVAYGSANAVDCVRLIKTLSVVPDLQALFNDNPIFERWTSADPCLSLFELIQDAFVDEPPVSTKEGGMFKEGYHAQLDEYRNISKEGKNWILALEAKEKERTGVKTLKIGYNRVFGYYIEVSKGALSQIKEEYGYVRKQTLVNAERFITSELKEKEDAILHSQERAVQLESQLFEELLDKIREYCPKLQKLANVLSEIDCIYALATTAASQGYVRPTFTEDRLNIEEGSHPILQAMKNTRYVSNGCQMDKNRSILLITGPNMGGKSTYMRQVALIVIMAQIGSFVPARKCEMPVFDKIFTRIGASDDILSGKSTFMVEMMEANAALSQATEKSLILFDEIGRGTSTYDGMSLAQAMIEYIAVCIKAKTLFSTHYHELTDLSKMIDTVCNVHVEVHESKGDITFMYHVKEGQADRSYGINVAKLAKLPESVLDRAKELCKQYESKKQVLQQSLGLVEMVKEPAGYREIVEKLENVNINNLTPMQALSLLDELKREIEEKK